MSRHAKTFGTAAIVAGVMVASGTWVMGQSRPSDRARDKPPATRATPRPTADAGVSPELRAAAEAAMRKALRYLEAVQTPDGAWQAQGQSDAAITAIAGQAFAQHPDYGPAHRLVRKALAFVMSSRREDGGIYPAGSLLGNYYTSVALMFLATQPKGERDVQKAIADAQAWLKKMQWTEDRQTPDGQPITTANPWYGGAGYGHSKRPDLSNTQMMLEALHQSGLPPSDPAYQKALKFISRCQMLSHANDQPFASGANDGGFIYTPAGGGESKAETAEAGGRQMLRSYGSMTYAGFKSMLYANVSRDDPRVKAAYDWIRSHYTLQENPNMPGARRKEGLFYYYHVFAKAMQAWGQDLIVDKTGGRHNWREDLIRQLLGLQREDGSWLNEADRWYESNPHYVTALAVLSLQAALEG